MGSGNTREISPKQISLGDGFGEVAVKVNGAIIEVHADGSIAAHTTGDVDAWTNASVRVHAAANDSEKVSSAPVELQPGARMKDGTVYAGLSPDTGQPMYAMPDDEPLTYTFKKAALQADANNMTNALGHQDWRVPTKGELNVLYNNRAAIGGFDIPRSHPAGWYYWSSSQINRDRAWDQRFSDGNQGHGFKGGDSSLRCVR